MCIEWYNVNKDIEPLCCNKQYIRFQLDFLTSNSKNTKYLLSNNFDNYKHFIDQLILFFVRNKSLYESYIDYKYQHQPKNEIRNELSGFYIFFFRSIFRLINFIFFV